jgi:hypothetical protein
LATFLNHFLSDSLIHHRNPRLSGVACRVLAQLLKRSRGRYVLLIPDLVDFLTRTLNVLAYRAFLSSLIRADPSVVPRTVEFYEFLLHDDAVASHAVQLIHEVAKPYGAIATVIATPTLTRRLLQIASTAPLPPFFSLLALEIVNRFPRARLILDVICEFESAFESAVDLRDCRLPVLLSLFPRRISLHLDDFLASRTSTMYDMALLDVFRTMSAAEFAAIVENPDVLVGAISRLGKDKVNGQITEFLKLVNDRGMIQSETWAEFAETILGPHIRRVNAPYGGAYELPVRRVMHLSPSSELMIGGDRVASSAPAPVSMMSDFNFIAAGPVAADDTEINLSHVPSLNGAAAATERRARKRNAGSVTLADLKQSLRV